MSEPQAQAAKSDLPTRFVAGVVMIAVALVAVYLGGWPFRALVAAAAAVMLVEWADMHEVSRRWAWIGAGLLVANLLVATEWFFPVGEVDAVEQSGELVEAIFQERLDIAWFVFAAIAGGGAVLALASRRVMLGLGYVYVGLPSAALLILSWLDLGPVLWVLVVTWATDIFAYFAGRAIGGPKLAARISPNKTWAGLIGGIAGAAVFGWLLATWFEMELFFQWMGGPMAVAAQAGDLFESWLKRRAGIKDSGTLLPGHGGVLDRLDGLLAVALATTLLLMAGLWTA
jgi:phosphatidate cytidylyltransferase